MKFDHPKTEGIYNINVTKK